MKLPLLLAALLTACAPIPPLQSGPYWFKSAEPSTLPEHVEISYRPPADCPVVAGSYDGLSCGPAYRGGKTVFLIWVRAGSDEQCVLAHERAHMRGWSHAQRSGNNSAERCAMGLE